MTSSPPPSSDELAKWLKVSREARTSIGRSLRTLDKAHMHIERLAAKVPPPATMRDDPGAG